jgi:hypothetical protein
VPHPTPLRFIYDGRRIYALPQAASPTVRHICEHPGTVLLFDAAQTTGPVLRVRAHAATRPEPHLTGWHERRAAAKYFLRPGGVRNMLTHWRNLPTWADIRRGATPADTALIEFVPRSGRRGDGERGLILGLHNRALGKQAERLAHEVIPSPGVTGRRATSS